MLKTLAIFLVLALVLHPTPTQAKAKGDTIGAPKKEVMSDTAKAKLDLLDIPFPTGTTFMPTAGAGEKLSTTTRTLTKSEKRAQIKEMKAEIKRLQKLIKTLSK